MGEIWISGASVASAYWEQPDESARSFGATCAGREGSFLRTGDLGFQQAGELFITGRLKDLIVFAGQNHYPEDIEATVQRSHPAVGRCAAFAVDTGARERLVVLGELGQRFLQSPDAPDLDAIARTVRQALAQRHGLRLEEWIVVQAGSLPVTTSGKIRRHACRELYLAGDLLQ